MSDRSPLSPKGQRQREKILTTALEVFADEGYRGTSLRTVAARCELSLAGVMHYFESREDLLVQILRRRDEVDEAAISPEHPLRDFLAVLARNTTRPGLIELFVTMSAAASSPEHPAAPYFRERYARMTADFAEHLETLGDTRPEGERIRDARALIALADGLQQQWVTDRSISIADELRRALAQHLNPLLSLD
ncbi:TetR/AcrR family transcriptional regulator [Mycetocola tolaasinivorans]|uniref:TetR/AcrR family transcriptional regulator n=1 Tax=Mycetocola tolaasinivorans TaxID=76635 RepID=A0A3L6ZXY1_9MICO|nr:TetR/AcrR family transcriptional regulator [Mycetocola tolaasinivorans]RLP72779.1 TetR/AcrR family transcriptional regulator [Mycetocola tolaasinivorans]